MKPITFWLQNDAINQLVEKYGSQLEKLTPENRRDLIAYLANANNYWSSEDSEADQAYRIARELSLHEKDLLIEAIAATLTHHGNPWLENARANVAIAQKEGTSSH